MRALRGCCIALCVSFWLPGVATAQEDAGRSGVTDEVNEPQAAAEPAPRPTAAPPLPNPEGLDDGPVLHANLREGFGVRSRDGNYHVRLGTLLSIRAGLQDFEDSPATPFANVRLARLYLNGNVFRSWVSFELQAEFALPSARLLDADVLIAPLAQVQLRVGQWRTPFGREFINGIGALQLPDRSIASDYFRAGRDTGLAVQGFPFDGKLEYYAGIFNGNGINLGGNENPQLMYMGRLVWSPLGRFAYDETQALTPGKAGFSLGLGAYHDRLGRTHNELDPTSGTIVEVPDIDLVRSTAGVDLALRAGPVFATAEGFMDVRDEDGGPRYVGAGGYVQGGVTVLPGRADLVARASMIAPDIRRQGSKGVQRYEVGGNYYFFSNNLKLQLRYAFTQAQSSFPVLPISVPAGHTLLLQLQLGI